MNLIDFDDELLYKRTKISFKDVEFTTPTKAGYVNCPSGPINEIYKRYDLKKLDKCLDDTNNETRANGELKSQNVANKINFAFLSYSDLKTPDEKHIELMSDLQYEHSDAIITPLWTNIVSDPNITGYELLESLNDLNNKFIEISKTMNNKNIVGVIPSKLPRQLFDKYMDNYIDNDVSHFVLDLDGKFIDSNKSWTRNLLRYFNDNDLFENSFIYAINAYEGRFSKDYNETLAKDYISHGFGVDILGLKHITPKLPKEQWSKFEAMGKEKPHKLFNSDSYGYMRVKESELFEITGADSTSNAFEVRRNFNIQEQYREDVKISTILSENSTVDQYLSSKPLVDEKTMDRIKKLKKKTVR